MTVEQGSFLSVDLNDAEIAELEAISHADLLAQTFTALTHELDTNGNTEEFLRLREAYSKKLIAFWAIKRGIYRKALEDGRITDGGPLNLEGERLVIQGIGDSEHTDDDVTLYITRETPSERDEVSVTINIGQGIDNFLRPPHIKSEIRTQPTEPANLVYEVSFRNKFISTLSRLVVHEDPRYQKPYIKDQRTIDCSIFGIDLIAERASEIT